MLQVAVKTFQSEWLDHCFHLRDGVVSDGAGGRERDLLSGRELHEEPQGPHFNAMRSRCSDTKDLCNVTKIVRTK